MPSGTVAKVWTKPRPGFALTVPGEADPRIYDCDATDLVVVTGAAAATPPRTVTVTDAPKGPPAQSGVSMP